MSISGGEVKSGTDKSKIFFFNIIKHHNIISCVQSKKIGTHIKGLRAQGREQIWLYGDIRERQLNVGDEDR